MTFCDVLCTMPDYSRAKQFLKFVDGPLKVTIEGSHVLERHALNVIFLSLPFFLDARIIPTAISYPH